MKVLIVSDIHGGYNNMKKVIDDNGEFDLLLVLGDILYGESSDNKLIELLNKYSSKIISVCGNCDRYVNNSKLDFFDDKLYVTVPIDGKLIFMSHGHIYNKYNLPNLSFDVFIQGHTHVPCMEIINNKLFLNPGSISIPRNGSSKSYIFYDNGVFYLKSVLENKIIKKIKLNN